MNDRMHSPNFYLKQEDLVKDKRPQDIVVNAYDELTTKRKEALQCFESAANTVSAKQRINQQLGKALQNKHSSILAEFEKFQRLWRKELRYDPNLTMKQNDDHLETYVTARNELDDRTRDWFVQLGKLSTKFMPSREDWEARRLLACQLDQKTLHLDRMAEESGQYTVRQL
jgi:hypothetical protein